MGDEAFIGRLVSCVTMIIPAQNSYVLQLKSVITNVLVYKAVLNLKFKCVCIAMCSLVMMSSFSRDLQIT